MPQDHIQPTDSLAITTIPAFNDNYIWLITETGSNKAWVVDPGDAEPVLAHLKAHPQLSLEGVLVTHHHPDHIGGIKDILAIWPSARVYGVASSRVDCITDTVSDGQTLSISESLVLQVLSVPGHTRDHIAFYRADVSYPALFAGDTLFSSGCGRLFEGTPAQMRQSLAKLRLLPENTQIYCAHEYTQANLAFAQAVEPENTDISAKAEKVAALREAQQPSIPTTLAEELATNPFLRWDVDAVKHAARLQDSNAIGDDQVFAAIRGWKDNF